MSYCGSKDCEGARNCTACKTAYQRTRRARFGKVKAPGSEEPRTDQWSRRPKSEPAQRPGAARLTGGIAKPGRSYSPRDLSKHAQASGRMGRT